MRRLKVFVVAVVRDLVSGGWFATVGLEAKGSAVVELEIEALEALEALEAVAVVVAETPVSPLVLPFWFLRNGLVDCWDAPEEVISKLKLTVFFDVSSGEEVLDLNKFGFESFVVVEAEAEAEAEKET